MLKIKEMQVTGLFDTFNHVITLKNQDHLTIIHGPNGFGKTVMLRMIASLIENDTSIFLRIPFKEFRISLDDGVCGVIRRIRSNGDKKEQDQIKLEVQVLDPNGATVRSDPNLDIAEVPGSFLDEIDKSVPGPYRRSRNGWVHSGSGEFYSLKDILSINPDLKNRIPKKYRPKMILPEITLGLSVCYVETNRLKAEASSSPSSSNLLVRQLTLFDEDVRTSRLRYSSRVEQYSQEIAQRIKSALADYAKHSQESDRTFPERLVRFLRENETSLPENTILDRMSVLENKRQRLISLGFLDSEAGLRDLTTAEDVRRAAEALTIYVGDVEEKLAVFDDLAHRVGKLIDIVNERFKYKRLAIHREKGFCVENDSGSVIDLDNLSSGEQHELVVLYELLFRSPKDGLVLVDEPEISLHVAWQSRFLSDLMSILLLTGSYGIVATHSPAIIGSRWDLTQQLKGPEATIPNEVAQ